MITIEQIIAGQDVPFMAEKTDNLTIFLETVVRPLEAMGYDLSIVHGIIPPNVIIHPNEPKARRNLIMGYGIDFSTGGKDDEVYEILKSKSILTTSLYRYDGYIHAAFNLSEKLQAVTDEETMSLIEERIRNKAEAQARADAEDKD